MQKNSQTDIVNLIDRAFVLTAKGDDLDKLGADYGIPRREAQAAIVNLEITGDEFSIINQDIKAVYNNISDGDLNKINKYQYKWIKKEILKKKVFRKSYRNTFFN
mgnify:CR=1 FL=1